MITLFRAKQIYAINDLKERMRSLLRQLPQMVAPTGNPFGFLRYELPCEPVDEFAWLHNQNRKEKFYWSGRDNTFFMAGIGTADVIETDQAYPSNIFEYIEDMLSADNPHLRYYGGLSFNPSTRREGWNDYPVGKFFVPRFELTKNNGQCSFVLNLKIAEIGETEIYPILNELDNIDFTTSTQYRSIPVVLKRTDFPDKKEWDEIFQKAIKNKDLQKVVLARKSIFTFNKAINPIALLKHLKDITPNCFHFCFQQNHYQGFIGASPERLFRKSGLQLETEALAGTTPRGKTKQEDADLSKKLLSSKKDAKEHKIVFDYIENKINSLCHTVSQDKQSSLLQIQGGQHLLTKIQGTLKENIRVQQILTDLHPTPAVAGSPQQTAIEFLEAVEPFQRGWYAAPVGYIGYDQAEFAVAIRCALIEKEQLSLFAGAGIVEGSVCDEEWMEIENKISNFISVFNR